MGTRALEIDVIGTADRFSAILGNDRKVEKISPRQGGYEVIYSGTPEDAAQLLASLVAEGVRVASFSWKRESLEEVFDKVGTKEVT